MACEELPFSSDQRGYGISATYQSVIEEDKALHGCQLVALTHSLTQSSVIVVNCLSRLFLALFSILDIRIPLERDWTMQSDY